MEITVFGASGAIGRLFVEQASQKGHKVKAYVRNPSKITLSHSNLRTIKGELSDSKNIKEAIEGSTVVISLLGPPLKRNYGGMAIVDAHTHIIAAMKELKVSRFITIATPSTRSNEDKRSIATVLPPIMAKLLFPKPYKEMVKIGELITNSGLDWTVVRFIAPTNKPKNGQVKVTYGDKKISFGIPRADIAAFVLDVAGTNQYKHSMPIIGS